MADSKIERIDQLFQSTVALPLGPDNTAGQEAAVGLIQELLTCQGYARLPTVRNRTYGHFGATTLTSLKDFRIRQGLQTKDAPVVVDHWTLRRLVQHKAPSARASRAYLALALDVEITGLVRILSLITLAEGAGKFSAFNGNSDKQGLSYGIIQWAQKPGRLTDIVEAYQRGQPALFRACFGTRADAMIAHTKKSKGGVDPKTGLTTDAQFELINPPWKDQFLNAAADKLFQKIQVETALVAFKKFIINLRTYAARPDLPTAKIKSERGYAFMIDLGNQHGTTDARRIYEKVVTAEVKDEAEALVKLTEESVKRVRTRYPPSGGEPSVFERSTQERRDFFRMTDLLANTDFDEN